MKKKMASHKLAPAPEKQNPEKITLMVQQAACEEFLKNVNEKQECIDAVATILHQLDSDYLYSVSKDLLDKNVVTNGLANILAVCASEIRIDVSQFRRDYCDTGIVNRLFKHGSAWRIDSPLPGGTPEEKPAKTAKERT